MINKPTAAVNMSLVAFSHLVGFDIGELVLKLMSIENSIREKSTS